MSSALISIRFAAALAAVFLWLLAAAPSSPGAPIDAGASVDPNLRIDPSAPARPGTPIPPKLAAALQAYKAGDYDKALALAREHLKEQQR